MYSQYFNVTLRICISHNDSHSAGCLDTENILMDRDTTNKNIVSWMQLLFVDNLLQRKAIPQYLQGIPSGLSLSFSQLLQSFEKAFPKTSNILRYSVAVNLASNGPL